MSPAAEPRSDPGSFIDDIEKRMGEIFLAQKSKVEQGLIEKISREKEEAQKRIEAVNKEFTQVRGFLEEHKAVMAKIRAAEDMFRSEIRAHLDRVQNYQKMMENAAGLAGEELEKVGGLNRELEKIRLRAEEEHANVKKKLEGFAGFASQLPAPPKRAAAEVDWNDEILKLKKVRDLLATLQQADFAAPASAATAPTASVSTPDAAGPASAEEIVAGAGDEFSDGDPAWADIPGADTGNLMVSPALAQEPYEEAALAEEPQAEAAPESSSVDAKHEAVLGALARYRSTEPVHNGLEIGFFTAESGAVLDAESFMTAVGKLVENAGDLHAQLGQAASVKNLFLLKQEILNQQEVLRKLFFRVVRFCEKEKGQLPETISEIISAQGMKDTIERLTMANWSDPSDFRPFMNELTAMKRAFEVRMAAAGNDYYQSVLDRVEGRD